MSSEDVALPIIDLSGYLNPKSQPEDRQRVVEQVRDAASQYGFFQVKGHGIPLELQRELVRCMGNVFNLPEEQKLDMSFLKNTSRRGYEASGMSHREGDALPDAKEVRKFVIFSPSPRLIAAHHLSPRSLHLHLGLRPRGEAKLTSRDLVFPPIQCFFIGPEDKTVELGGIYGPNVWPDLPEADFRSPVWAYYQQTSALGRTLWSVLLEGLGQPARLVDKFAQRPIVPMKMIRYPPHRHTAEGQFGIGAHTDFGGITILFQQPGKDGLEVWHDGLRRWIDVPALEDVYVINCGDMIQRWSGGAYKSARHRVINKADGERMSCATFWHGDVGATNPLRPDDPNRETVGQLLAKRFRNQYSFTKELLAEIGSPS